MHARRRRFGNFSTRKAGTPSFSAAAKPKTPRPVKTRRKAKDTSSIKSSNWGALNTPEKRAAFCTQLQISGGNLIEAEAEFGVADASIRYWFRKDPQFKADVKQIMITYKRIRKRSEDQMRDRVMAKWYDAIINKDVSNKDMEAFMAYFNSKTKAAKADEAPSGPIPKEDQTGAI